MAETDNGQVLANFMDVTGADDGAALQMLEATNWHLEAAVELFFAGEQGTDVAASGGAGPGNLDSYPSIGAREGSAAKPEAVATAVEEEYVRPPLPIKREALYDDGFLRSHMTQQQATHIPASVDAFRNFQEEALERARLGQSDAEVAAGSAGARDSLSTLYRPPFDIMMQGNFEQAKQEGVKQGKWLLVNVQSTKEFASYMLNRDTWSQSLVKETVGSYFVFWQINNDQEEGQKICRYYKLYNFPAVLVIDPITGQKMRLWDHSLTTERLLEELLPYMDRGPMDKLVLPPSKKLRDVNAASEAVPKEMQAVPSTSQTVQDGEDEEFRQALAASLLPLNAPASTKANAEAVAATVDEASGSDNGRMKLSLPSEPEQSHADSCRVAVRLPSGLRKQRKFLQTDPVQILHAYCCVLEPEAAEGKSFKLSQVAPGNPSVDLTSGKSLKEAGLANALVIMTWL